MKGKIFAIICMIALLSSLTACSSSSEKVVYEVRKQTQEPETCISDNETEEATPTNIIDYLDKQVETWDYDAMTGVADCDQAIEQHLLKVAQYCVQYAHSDLAKKVLNNENCTELVIEELATSSDYDILEIITLSREASKKALIKIVEYCVQYGHSDLAGKVLNNENCTELVIEELATSSNYDILEIITLSSKASEKVLIMIAEYCAEYCSQYGHVDLAKKVLANENCTKLVVEELATSDYYDVLELITLSDKVTKKALIKIAGYCAQYGHVDLAKKVLANEKCSKLVVKELATSDYYDVLELITLSDKATKKVLSTIAEYCARYGHVDLANEVINNENCTISVANILVKSEYEDVQFIGQIWIESQ